MCVSFLKIVPHTNKGAETGATIPHCISPPRKTQGMRNEIDFLAATSWQNNARRLISVEVVKALRFLGADAGVFFSDWHLDGISDTGSALHLENIWTVLAARNGAYFVRDKGFNVKLKCNYYNLFAFFAQYWFKEPYSNYAWVRNFYQDVSISEKSPRERNHIPRHLVSWSNVWSQYRWGWLGVASCFKTFLSSIQFAGPAIRIFLLFRRH